MAAGAVGEERPTLFLRKATGLVRGWSVRDSLIYACLATNFAALGLFYITYANPAFPKGQLITAVVISGIWISFLVIAYTGLVVTIPRAGGDYVWQTRILGSGIGFVMAATGWWFILWLWAPIYGNILAVQLFEPLWATLKWTWPGGGAAWFGTHNGVFIVSLITIVLAGFLVSIGMAGYAKVQRWCFIGGLVGIAVIVILLLFNSHADFIAAFNREGQDLFGVKNSYVATNAAAVKAGYTTSPLGFGPLGPTMLLIPFLMAFLLWPNWGTTLYGEVRGASDFRRVFSGMFFGLWTHGRHHGHLPAADQQDRRLGFLPEPQLAVQRRQPDVRHLAVPVHVRGLAGEQHRLPGNPDPGAQPVVLRLGGNLVPVLDPGHLRRRVRPRAPRPGG